MKSFYKIGGLKKNNNIGRNNLMSKIKQRENIPKCMKNYFIIPTKVLKII